MVVYRVHIILFHSNSFERKQKLTAECPHSDRIVLKQNQKSIWKKTLMIDFSFDAMLC